MYSIYSKFNIQKHKETYVNYLEAIILEDGSIEYAIPSHQEYLINLACKIYNITRYELSEKCPKEYYFDFMTWLCMQTNTIAVWNNYIIYNEINEKQLKTLKLLKENDLYKGDII